jgi:hypothetical protein
MKVKVNGQIIMRGAFSASIKGLCKYIAAAGAHPAVFVVSLFLYYYYEADPLRHGLDLGHVGVLLAVTVVLLLIGVMTVGKRDLQV